MAPENNSFKMGLRDGMPIALGYLAVSFGFGIIASSAGFLWYEALLVSMLNLTSAGQLAAVPIIAGGGSLLELALAQLTINSRYALMSVSLSQKLSGTVRLRDRFAIGFANTDEIFAVAVGKGAPLGRRYMYALAIGPCFGWSAGTLLGALAGEVLPGLAVTALSVSLYAMFIAIIVPAVKKSLSLFFACLFAAALSALFTYLPALSTVSPGFVIVICTVAVSALFALIRPLPDEEEVAG